jgi:hypothetical protein
LSAAAYNLLPKVGHLPFIALLIARLALFPKGIFQRNLPEKNKLRQALEFLRENPIEEPIPTTRLFNLKKPGTLQKAWKHERQRVRKKKNRG